MAAVLGRVQRHGCSHVLAKDMLQWQLARRGGGRRVHVDELREPRRARHLKAQHAHSNQIGDDRLQELRSKIEYGARDEQACQVAEPLGADQPIQHHDERVVAVAAGRLRQMWIRVWLLLARSRRQRVELRLGHELQREHDPPHLSWVAVEVLALIVRDWQPEASLLDERIELVHGVFAGAAAPSTLCAEEAIAVGAGNPGIVVEGVKVFDVAFVVLQVGERAVCRARLVASRVPAKPCVQVEHGSAEAVVDRDDVKVPQLYRQPRVLRFDAMPRVERHGPLEAVIEGRLAAQSARVRVGVRPVVRVAKFERAVQVAHARVICALRVEQLCLPAHDAQLEIERRPWLDVD